jgi:GWxTD domain-containing protein
MRKLLFSSLLLITALSLQAGNIKAYLSYCTFQSPQDGPYLESYLSIYAKSLVFTKNTNGKYQGNVAITMIFKQGATVKDFKKYELKSPEAEDTTKLDFSFIDQQRFLLPNGDYSFEFSIKDLNSKKPESSSNETVRIQFPTEKVSISGIQLIGSYSPTSNVNVLSKSGFDLVPYVFDYYPPDINKLIFYAEIYNTEKVIGPDSKYLISYAIQPDEPGKISSGYAKMKKEISKPVNSVIQEFDISSMPSGNYNLIIEARNQQNEVIATNSLFFQRSNPNIQYDANELQTLVVENSFVGKTTNKDTLREYIKCLNPISSELDKLFIDSQLMNMDVKTMQQYFLNFWITRAPSKPEQSWLAYKAQVDIVNQSYKTPIKKGYETDRGRIYLKYGAPNTISDQPFEASNSGMFIGDARRDGDNGNVPYQIWHYYQLKNNQRDKKFVFANPYLATNEYALIHSNAQGEVNNPNWQADLTRQIGIQDRDETAPGGRYGNKSGDLYLLPR